VAFATCTASYFEAELEEEEKKKSKNENKKIFA